MPDPQFQAQFQVRRTTRTINDDGTVQSETTETIYSSTLTLTAIPAQGTYPVNFDPPLPTIFFSDQAGVSPPPPNIRVRHNCILQCEVPGGIPLPRVNLFMQMRRCRMFQNWGAAKAFMDPWTLGEAENTWEINADPNGFGAARPVRIADNTPLYNAAFIAWWTNGPNGEANYYNPPSEHLVERFVRWAVADGIWTHGSRPGELDDLETYRVVANP